MDKAPSNMLSIEERTMARDLILLRHIDTMVNRSVEEIEHTGNVLKKLYLTAGHYIQQRIIQDIQAIQKEFHRRHIRVEPGRQEDFLLYYNIYYRGYQEEFGMTRDITRTEISLRLTQYTSELGAGLKEALNEKASLR